MASPDDMAEFQALSVKVSAKTATEPERARWRELRALLAKPQQPPPPPQIARQHARAQKKLKVEFAPLTSMHATFTEEVSPGGIKVRVQGHVDTGAMMVVRLELGEPGPLTLSARVAWCKRDAPQKTF
ncbi:MAG TPA: PilZ domain-containing protein, partial [Polyangia bacterium]